MKYNLYQMKYDGKYVVCIFHIYFLFIHISIKNVKTFACLIVFNHFLRIWTCQKWTDADWQVQRKVYYIFILFQSTEIANMFIHLRCRKFVYHWVTMLYHCNSSKCIICNETDFQPIIDEEKVYLKKKTKFSIFHLCKLNKNFWMMKITSWFTQNACKLKFFVQLNLKDYVKCHLSI